MHSVPYTVTASLPFRPTLIINTVQTVSILQTVTTPQGFSFNKSNPVDMKPSETL
jgi:hypothetical protein